jgi:hypothetical protein
MDHPVATSSIAAELAKFEHEIEGTDKFSFRWFQVREN